MSEKRCGTCKFWGAEAEGREKRYGGDERPCGHILYEDTYANGDERAVLNAQNALARGCCGYCTYLVTRADFGCVLHKAKE